MRLLNHRHTDPPESRTFGPDGYDRFGFNRAGLHRDTQDRYSPDGYDCNGDPKPSATPLLRLR